MATLKCHIVSSIDSTVSARYLVEVLGLEPAVRLGEVAVVSVGGDTTSDFITTRGYFDRQHYAFLVTEGEFDEIFARIRERGQEYWADSTHKQPGEVNHWDDGRGAYCDHPGWASHRDHYPPLRQRRHIARHSPARRPGDR